MPKVINTNQFRNHVEECEGIVVIDFYAPWCRPCKMLSPIFESLSIEYDGKVQFLKVDIDSSLEIASRFNVSSVPTVMIFKNGKPVQSMVGFMPKEKLNKAIKAHL